MKCCDSLHQCSNCPTRPAAVAPIKLQRRSCEALGVCQNRQERCTDCTPQEKAAIESDLATLNDMPADVWDRISFWAVTGIAGFCTVAMVCGTAGWAYTRWLV